MQQSPTAVYQPRIASLRRAHSGKVRDIYTIDDEHMLIVASDRLSAFDVVLPDPIPGKGVVLTAMSSFWFRRTADLIPNHLAELPLEQVLPDPEERAQVEGRAVVARRLRALPIEAIVRGYIAGSGWKDYRRTGRLCGFELPSGLRQADALPEPLFTPSTKAAKGEHDQNIAFDEMVELIGYKLAEAVQSVSLAIYRRAAAHARERGIIVADTKLEFGVDADDRLYLIDEVVTPDSSRFWPADRYAPGSSPPSFDKQFVRDYLEGVGWNKRPPAPHLPSEIVEQTANKYREAYERLAADD